MATTPQQTPLSQPFLLGIDSAGKKQGETGYNTNKQIQFKTQVAVGSNPDASIGVFAKNPTTGKDVYVGTIDKNKIFKPDSTFNAYGVSSDVNVNKKISQQVRSNTKDINQKAIQQAKDNNIKAEEVTNNPPATKPDDSKGLTSGSTEDKALSEISSKYRGRQDYPDVHYPKKLKLNEQDCIKFTIIRYNPSTLASSNTSQRNVGFLPNKDKTNRSILGSITLPIPGNIADKNDADWQKQDMSVIDETMANTVNSFLVGGADAGKNAAEQGVKSISSDTNILKGFVAAKTTEGILGTSNLLARQYGAVSNPNTELLFNGPSLRDFGFTFKMSPRSPEEAKDVRTIIRYFKQAMSVKRTESVLLLRSPHTFAISYLSGNKEHPYLNKFKECALTNCSVNYTPYGSYMTYDGNDKSMVAYELSLTFQELEPVFDDDYIDGDKIPTEIGY
jgi:hypothetical protein